MEVYVLTELNKRNNRHFCKIEDKGRFGTFNYVVMTLVGKSLQVIFDENYPGIQDPQYTERITASFFGLYFQW